MFNFPPVPPSQVQPMVVFTSASLKIFHMPSLFMLFVHPQTPLLPLQGEGLGLSPGNAKVKFLRWAFLSKNMLLHKRFHTQGHSYKVAPDTTPLPPALGPFQALAPALKPSQSYTLPQAPAPTGGAVAPALA